MPWWPKDIKGFGKYIIVDKSCVHGEQPHEEDDVAAAKEYVPNLEMKRQKTFKGKNTLMNNFSYIIALFASYIISPNYSSTFFITGCFLYLSFFIPIDKQTCQ